MAIVTTTGNISYSVNRFLIVNRIEEIDNMVTEVEVMTEEYGGTEGLELKKELLAVREKLTCFLQKLSTIQP
jgi:uncharacterized protein YdcH (DUF465 family)